MTNIRDDLKQAIEKNLPQMVGDELQVILKEYDKQKLLLTQYVETNAGLTEANKELHDFRSKSIALDQRRNLLDERESAVILKESLLTLRELHAKERVVAQTSSQQYMAPTKDQYGNQMYPQSFPVSTTTSVTGE